MKRTARVSKAAKDAKKIAQQTARGREARHLAKSADPDFIKFTTYIKKRTHRAVKMRVVGQEREMSDLVEDLLSGWLKENDSDED